MRFEDDNLLLQAIVLIIGLPILFGVYLLIATVTILFVNSVFHMNIPLSFFNVVCLAFIWMFSK